MKKSFYIGFVVVIAIVLAIPFFVKQKLETSLQEHQKNMQEYGIDVKIIGIEGYFNSKTNLEYKITDGKKFFNFLLDKAQKFDPNVEIYTKTLKAQMSNLATPVFSGVTFEALLNSSNLLPSDYDMSLSLVKFSDEAMLEIQSDKEVQDLILPILNEKMLTLFIKMDTNAKIKSIQMKDITLAKQDEFDIKILKNKLDLDYDKGINGTYTIGKQLYKSQTSQNRLFSLEMDNLTYVFNYISQFNSKANISIENIALVEKKYSRLSSFRIQKLGVDTKVSSPNNINLDAYTGYSLKGINIQDRKMNYTLDEANLKISLSNLLKDDLLALSNAYRDVLLQNDRFLRQEATKIMLEKFVKIVNNGLKSTLDLSIKGSQFQNIIFKDIALNVDATIPKNEFNLEDKQSFKEALDMISVKGSLSMEKSDAEAILMLDKSLQKLVDLAVERQGKLYFDIEVKNSQLFINSNKI